MKTSKEEYFRDINYCSLCRLKGIGCIHDCLTPIVSGSEFGQYLANAV